MKNFIITLTLLACSLNGLCQSAKEYYEKGVAKYVAKNNSGAIRQLDQAIKLNPEYTEAYQLRGNARMRSFNQMAMAISDYDKVLSIDPTNVKAYNNRGLAKSSLGNYKSAIEDYNKAIELDPNAAFAYKNRGDTKKLMDDLPGALADFEKATDVELENKAKKSRPPVNLSESNDTLLTQLELNGKQINAKEIVVDMSAFITAEETIIEAGEELQKARRTFGAGLFLNLIGGGLLAGSGFAKDPKVQTGLLISGTVCAVVGSIVVLFAIVPVGEAGIRLQKVRFPRSVRIKVE